MIVKENEIESKENGETKTNLITIKGQQVTRSDFRGLLAIILVLAFIYVVCVGNYEAVTALGPLTGSAVGYYFHCRVCNCGNDRRERE